MSVTVRLPSALPVDLAGRSLLRVRDWTAAELEATLDLADELKAKQRRREPHRLLEGRTLGLLFRKHSTRTRVSLEVAAAHLGATAVYLPGDELQLARGESIEDTARVLGRYLDALAIRTHAHAEVDAFAVAGIPVINALTDEAHPLQALADLQTIRERFGTLEGIRVAWIGDGNNVCASLAEACTVLGATFVCAAPAGYEPHGVDARRESERGCPRRPRPRHGRLDEHGAGGGARGAIAQRSPATASTHAYSPEADPEAIVLHCLPAHPGEEIAADVLYGPQSAVWDEAENRLHTAKAVLALTLG